MNKHFENPEGPPAAFSTHPGEPNQELRTISINLPPLTAEELREACYAHAKENRCYGSRWIRAMDLTNIQHEFVFEYVLQSLCEKRENEETITPYFGQEIDDLENGPGQLTCEIPISSLEDMVDKQMRINIPHSSYLTQCNVCMGNKTLHCTECIGNGKVVCKSCGGNSNASCLTCVDRDVETCMTCVGTGRTECSTCKGEGKVVISETVIVTWRNVCENVISNPANLPKELIPGVEAKEMLIEEGNSIQPVNVVPPKEINRTSALLIKKHLADIKHTTEQVILQRQILRVIPVTKVKYAYKGEEGEFFVYGLEKKVYFENYPNSSCGWCCCFC